MSKPPIRGYVARIAANLEALTIDGGASGAAARFQQGQATAARHIALDRRSQESEDERLARQLQEEFDRAKQIADDEALARRIAQGLGNPQGGALASTPTKERKY
jgi:hypothetical protein